MVHPRVILISGEVETIVPVVRGVLDGAPQKDLPVVGDTPDEIGGIVDGASVVDQRSQHLRCPGEQRSCTRAVRPVVHRVIGTNVVGNRGGVVLVSLSRSRVYRRLIFLLHPRGAAARTSSSRLRSHSRGPADHERVGEHGLATCTRRPTEEV